MDPRRLAAFTRGPPPAIEPTTFRFDTEPCTDAPMTLIDPAGVHLHHTHRASDPLSSSECSDAKTHYPVEEGVNSTRATEDDRSQRSGVRHQLVGRELLWRLQAIVAGTSPQGPSTEHPAQAASGVLAVISCASPRSESVQLLMKARMSGLTTSAWVVHMPCGNFSYTFKVPLFSNFIESMAESAIGTI
jgi:hypothetical protein